MFKILILILLLSGCAVTDSGLAGAGSAVYSYERQLPDGSRCSVSLTSGRDVLGGKLTIGPDCTVVSEASSTQGVVSSLKLADDAMVTVKQALEKIP